VALLTAALGVIVPEDVPLVVVLLAVAEGNFSAPAVTRSVTYLSWVYVSVSRKIQPGSKIVVAQIACIVLLKLQCRETVTTSVCGTAPDVGLKTCASVRYSFIDDEPTIKVLLQVLAHPSSKVVPVGFKPITEASRLWAPTVVTPDVVVEGKRNERVVVD
jgi:hypothetical protein